MENDYPYPGVEAKVLRKLPAQLERQIGRVAMLYTVLEHCLTQMIAVILRLQKAEARLVVTTPRVQDRLTIVQDLLALKDIHPNFDFDGFRELLREVNDKRNDVVHGIWLKVPNDKRTWLRLTRGKWTKEQAHAPHVRRVIYPQAVPVGAEDCKRIAKMIGNAIKSADSLGKYVDRQIAASPEKFRSPAPLVNPLGLRPKTKKQQARQTASRA